MEFIHQPKQEAKKRTLPNLTGIPTQMKLDFEQRSGLSFDDVRVHYSSEKPAQVQALAYTQGTQVYLGPGQERHLPHELGHVVQQKSGLVRLTRSANGLHINDDPALERQADHIPEYGRLLSPSPSPDAVIQCAPGSGIGIELETSSVKVRVKDPPDQEKKKDNPRWWQESFWKGRQLKTYTADSGAKWAITIDTTSFNPDIGSWQFTLEIVVDGTQLKLDSEENVMQEIGADIKEVLQSEKLSDSYEITGESGEKFILEKESGELTENTVFSIQVTCGMPLDKVYDLLDSDSENKLCQRGKQRLSEEILVSKKEVPLNTEEMTALLKASDTQKYMEEKGIYSVKSERTKEDKEIYTFLYLLQQIFAESHDPKQEMAAMPRTSMKKIFMMLSEKQRETILSYLNGSPKDDNAYNIIDKLPAYIKAPREYSIGDSEKVSFEAYREYLASKETPELDPIANHPEELGICKLKGKTERGFLEEELPIFEFRKIGGCSLKDLPDYLKSINEDIIKMFPLPE